MPVTKTAKRALRSSKRKEAVNQKIITRLGLAVRIAKKGKAKDKILEAVSLVDRAVKKSVIHQNKAARIKSTLTKLLPKSPTKTKSRKSIKK